MFLNSFEHGRADVELRLPRIAEPLTQLDVGRIIFQAVEFRERVHVAETMPTGLFEHHLQFRDGGFLVCYQRCRMGLVEPDCGDGGRNPTTANQLRSLSPWFHGGPQVL
jgi:hypothetical protein